MSISLLDDSLNVSVYYEKTDAEFEDNICLCFSETCQEDEKLFMAEQTNVYLTIKEARALVQALIDAIEASQYDQ